MATGQGESERVETVGEPAEEAAESASAAGAGDVPAPDAGPAERLRETEARLEQALRDLEAAKGEAEQLRDQYLRLRAEFDNFRKRTRSEVEAIKARAAEDLVVALLPVVDNLERAIGAAKTAEGAPKGLVDGVDMVLRQLLAELSAVGVSRIEALGAPFDPNLHEAVAYEERDDHPDGCVIEVFQTGYSFNEKVLRPSVVKVARARGAQEGKSDE